MKTSSHTKQESSTQVEKELVRELHNLSKTLMRIEDLRPFDIIAKPGKFLWYAFMKGVMVGFGSVLGATLLIALLIFILKQIQFTPIIGDFVQNILEYINPK